jgi:hypothetical protein
MWRITTHCRLWLTPAILAGATLAACSDDPTTQTRTNTGDTDSSGGTTVTSRDRRDARGACIWTSDVNNTPVFPPSDLGGPPTPDSVLIFEKCDGDWTGNMAWFQR